MAYISTIDLTDLEWLQQRQNFITASGFASIIGANPYQTPYQYWLEKKSQIPIVNDFDSERMEIGREIEDFIAKYWSKKFNRKVMKDNKIRINTEYHMAVNMDRVIVKDNENTPGYLECKNIDAYVYNSWDDGVNGKKSPIYYYLQVMFGLAVTGYEFGHHAILVGGNHLVDIPYKRDESFIDEIMSFSKGWWDKYILGDEIPDKEVSDFKLTKIENIKGSIEADQQFIILHKMLLETKSELAKWKERKDDLEAQLQAKIGDNELVTYQGQEIATWKGQKRMLIDEKKLKLEKPEIYNEYSYASEFRVLRQKQIKEIENNKSEEKAA